MSSTPDTWPLSARDAAALLGVNERTIRRAIARGELPATKHGGAYRIAHADLTRYGARHRHPPPPIARSREPSLHLVPFPEHDTAGPSILPQPRSTLIGREQEIAAVGSLLLRLDVPLVTLTGPGGVGKTRLALQVAADLETGFADGVVFVPLAPVRDPALVLPAIALAFGIQEGGARPLPDRLATVLSTKTMLLILDNFEQVTAASPAVAELLARCRHLTCLVTSRELLNLSEEHVVAVSPLPLPDPAATAVEEIAAADAVRLFLTRAQTAGTDIALTAENAATVAAICRRLDGLPLAIQLVAARVTVLPPRVLLARLDRALPLLTGGARDQPERLRTMRDAIAWSYDLLNPEEQSLFRRLSVFVGGCSLKAAEAVAKTGDAPVGDVLAGVTSLVDKSLLRRVTGTDPDEPRYAMLETIREYGLERLADSGEEAAIRSAHAAHFLATFAPVGSLAAVRTPAELDLLELELANLRTALAWLAETGDETAVLLLAIGTHGLWYMRGPASEGQTWLERAAIPARGVELGLRGWALMWASSLAHRQNDFLAGTTLGELAVSLFREVGDEPEGLAWAMSTCGIAAYYLGDNARAIVWHEDALTRFRALGLLWPVGMTLGNLGVIALDQGDDAPAEAHLTEAIAVHRLAGDTWVPAWALAGLAGLALRRRDLAGAVAAAREATLLAGMHNDLTVVAEVLVTVGAIAADQGRAAIATRLFGAESALRDIAGPRFYRGLQLDRERLASTSRAALGEVAFAEAWAEGRTWSVARSKAEAETTLGLLEGAVLSSAETSRLAMVTGTGLSPREVEVLRLVVAGKATPEIAAALFVSPRTVQTHLTNVYGKLGVANRAEAVAWAVRNGVA